MNHLLGDILCIAFSKNVYKFIHFLLTFIKKGCNFKLFINRPKKVKIFKKKLYDILYKMIIYFMGISSFYDCLFLNYNKIKKSI